MLIKNRLFLHRLILSESKDFLWINWRKIILCIFILLILIEGYQIFSFYSRLELIDRCEYHDDVFDLYMDWSKSTNYYMKYSERMNAKNYYVIKKIMMYTLNLDIIISLM